MTYNYRYQHCKPEDVATGARIIKDELGWQDTADPKEALQTVIGKMMDLCDLIAAVAPTKEESDGGLRR